MTLKLNIGAGNTKLEGFVAIDRRFGTEAYPLDYPSGGVAEIRASHILEHFSFAEVPAVLSEWARVLKPGGRIRIAVPDFDKIVQMALKGGDDLWHLYLMGGQTDENDYHKSLFTAESLRQQMEIAGLVKVERWESDNTDTASHRVSLNLEGIKRE